MHTLERTQHLPIGLDKAWEFFSSPHNLSVITPDDMGFEVLSGAEDDMYEGQIISYTVRPIFGIPIKWVSRIQDVIEKKQFVDIQLKGPYKHWHHTHTFTPTDKGVEMKDVIRYQAPMGMLGRMIEPILVRPRLEKIFDYRFKTLEEMFK